MVKETLSFDFVTILRNISTFQDAISEAIETTFGSVTLHPFKII